MQTVHARSLRRRIAIRTAAVVRWIHIYLSMFGLAAVLFFGVTGVTLNHPEWFGESERRVAVQGQMKPEWLHLDQPAGRIAGDDDESRRVAKLEVVEHLRKTHGVRGAVSEFRADAAECTVTFKGPGYAADAYIDRSTGRYELTQTMHGFVAVINDLHKGRDTGTAWSVVIDASAIVLVVISFSGLVLLFYLKRKRIPGLLVAVGGTAVVVAVVMFLVP